MKELWGYLVEIFIDCFRGSCFCGESRAWVGYGVVIPVEFIGVRSVSMPLGHVAEPGRRLHGIALLLLDGLASLLPRPRLHAIGREITHEEVREWSVTES